MKEQENRSKEIRPRDEDTGSNRSHGDGTPIYLTGNSTLQSNEEHAHDQSVDSNQDTSMSVSNDDLHDIKAGQMTGRADKNDEQP